MTADALWAYGVVGAGTDLSPVLRGVAGEHAVERIDEGDLAVMASRVPRSEFAEEPLRRNLNDLAWLERVARAHEEVLERALESGPVVPLRLCTIFDDEPGARRMLAASPRRAGAGAADARGTLGVGGEAARRPGRPDGRGGGRPRAGRSGRAVRHRRRLPAPPPRGARGREAADRLAAALAEDVHDHLRDWADAAVIRPAQNRDLSGHEGEMLLNGAYLVAGRAGRRAARAGRGARRAPSRVRGPARADRPVPRLQLRPAMQS